MTDTTDIKALREKVWDLDEAHDLRQLGDDIIDALEAERQRAETASAGWLKVIDERDASRSHVAGLEERLRYTEETLVASNDLLSAAEAEISALKAKLANPVVLPVVQNIGGDEWYWKDGIIRNIQEAGFTVKEK